MERLWVAIKNSIAGDYNMIQYYVFSNLLTSIIGMNEEHSKNN